MKHTYSLIYNSPLERFTKTHTFKSFKVYLAAQEWVYEQVRIYDFEQSFTGQFLKAGFESYLAGFIQTPPHTLCSIGNLNPRANWHGVSVYEPDWILKKGDLEIVMSLQGMISPRGYDKKIMDGFKNGTIKYIGLFNGETIIYQDWFGNLPSKEIVKVFLN